MRRYHESETGGWGLGIPPQPSDLDLPGGSSYCELTSFDGFPSQEEFALLIDRNEPVLFRGAALGWQIRELWKKGPFLDKCVCVLLCAADGSSGAGLLRPIARANDIGHL